MNVIQPIEKTKIENKKMKKLEDEHLWLQRQIARSGAHKKKDKKMKIELQKSLLFRMAAQQKCDAHVSMMQQYNDLIQKNYKETMNLRKLASTTQGEIEERRWQSEYRLMSAENKLEAAKMRFNAVQFKVNLHSALFNQAWNKMQAALNDRREWMERKENKLDTKIEELRHLLAEQKTRTDALRKKNEEKDQLIQKFMNHINDMFTRPITVSKIWLDGVHEPYTGSLEEASNTSCTVGRCNFKLIGLVVHCRSSNGYEAPNTYRCGCVEARWLSRIFDGTELPFDKNMALNALKELSSDPAYMRSDRVHTIMECIVPRSRAILARRYVNQ
ncbi:hypothetical protein HF086_000402 [Spodoptera exigua]|uniref:Uncharacterized protein n=1 Tax=Spodoptera exigua TaxID=7107 RepID=A0A922M9U5_SPOEX|nr:hypothetical protein HF086_000402 [Spodoptera exigua]